MKPFVEVLAAYREAHKDDGKKFAWAQIDYIKSLGFTKQQAWWILSGAGPTRCAHAACWGVQLYQRGFRAEHMHEYWPIIVNRLKKVKWNQNRYRVLTEVFAVTCVGHSIYDSVNGIEKFFNGAITAMSLYHVNVNP